MKNKGFSLVELIVVIAIMAILVGVAVPVYSSYIEKSQIAKDKQLVDEVAHALTVYHAANYASNPEGLFGYVVLTPEGTEGGSYADEVGAAAMEAIFGTNWETELALSYDNWKLSTSMPSAADASKVAASSFYKNSTPAELVSSFSGLTDSLATMAATAGQDPLDTMQQIGVISDLEYESMREVLDGLKVSWSSEAGADNTAYSTAVSNLMVQKVSTEIGGDTFVDDENPSGLGELAVAYAQIYAWASTGDSQGVAALDGINKVVANQEASSQDVVEAVFGAMDAALADGSSFKTYQDKNLMTDLHGLSSIMGTVSKWSAGSDLTVPGLYSSDSISGAVNNYMTAVGAMEKMDETEINALIEAFKKGVVVFISPDGTVGYNVNLG